VREKMKKRVEFRGANVPNAQQGASLKTFAAHHLEGGMNLEELGQIKALFKDKNYDKIADMCGDIGNTVQHLRFYLGDVFKEQRHGAAVSLRLAAEKGQDISLAVPKLAMLLLANNPKRTDEFPPDTEMASLCHDALVFAAGNESSREKVLRELAIAITNNDIDKARPAVLALVDIAKNGIGLYSILLELAERGRSAWPVTDYSIVMGRAAATLEGKDHDTVMNCLIRDFNDPNSTVSDGAAIALSYAAVKPETHNRVMGLFKERLKKSMGSGMAQTDY
jgi:hypothetical protein